MATLAGTEAAAEDETKPLLMQSDSSLTKAPSSSNDVTGAMKKVTSFAGVATEDLPGLTSHSLKATWQMVTAGAPCLTRTRQLGYHVQRGEGSAENYNGDNLDAHMEVLRSASEAVADGSFHPDAVRSRRWKAGEHRPIASQIEDFLAGPLAVGLRRLQEKPHARQDDWQEYAGEASEARLQRQAQEQVPSWSDASEAQVSEEVHQLGSWEEGRQLLQDIVPEGSSSVSEVETQVVSSSDSDEAADGGKEPIRRLTTRPSMRRRLKRLRHL